MIRRSRLVSAVLACGMLTALAGCAPGPDPAAVHDRASEVFDDLVAALDASDPAVVRAVEVLPESRTPCEEEGLAQSAFLARGSLSVAAADDAAKGVLDSLAATLDAERWTPVSEGADPGAERAWSSEEGIVVTMTDASPIVVIGVFPPCAE